MDRKHWKNMLPVIQAYANGENIEFDYGNGIWCDVTDEMHMAFVGKVTDYRIKPKTKIIKTRRALMHRPIDNGLVVIIWCDSYSDTQENLEQLPTFLRWLEDTQIHEFEI